ncbi:MAG: endonuclease MutS2 [Clostridiales bacterium]|nr:endonuclease MutS2 [Clostridiales bacterium]
MYRYTTFEEEAERKKIKGRVLSVLEFDKVKDKLLELTRTSYGRSLASSLYPTTDVDFVKLSLEDTFEAYTYISKYGSIPLGSFPAVDESLRYIKAGGVLDMRALLDVAIFLRSADELKRIVFEDKRQDMSDTDLFTSIAALEPEIRLRDEILSCILNESEMNDRASSELYSIRRETKDVVRSIRVILDRIIRNSGDILQEQIITIRDGRYCVPVKSEMRGRLPGIIHDTSSTGQTVFIEPMGVVDANNRLRELASLEEAEIERILKNLTMLVDKSSNVIRNDISLIAQIDLNSAKGELAVLMNAVKPDIKVDGTLELIKARHPLIDKDSVVPVDIRNGKDYSTLVITGPNTGGKTVSLKTCGLMTLMTMTGLMIPCAPGTSVTVFDRVLADIGDEQSIEQSLSTFSAHISNIVFILKNIRGRSLVLLDELGSGTDPAEGAALAVAVLDALKAKGCVVMATTHYRELKEYAVTTDGVMNASCEFDTDTLSPTYRLIIGTSGTSNAFVISKKLGMPGRIIDDAKSRMTDEDLKLEKLLSEAEVDRRKAGDLQKENERLNVELKDKIQELEEERKALKSSKTKILNETRAKQRELLEDKQEELDDLIREIKAKARADYNDDAKAELDRIRRRLRAGVKDLSADDEDEDILRSVSLPGEHPKNVIKGEKYFVPHLNATGVALDSSDKESAKIRIKSGSMTYTVKVNELRMPTGDQLKDQEPEDPKKRRFQTAPSKAGSTSSMKVMKAQTVVSELMLLGKTVAEAESELDKYIDDCQLAGLKTVRIVHGKGTGALRSAVDARLSMDPRVRDFRLGDPSEGGDGVTIAMLS